MKYSTVELAGLATASVTRAELAQIMVEDCFRRKRFKSAPKLVFSLNGQGVSLVGQSVKFAEAMNEADIVHADGQSVVFASRLLSNRGLPERVATTDFFHDAAEAAQANGLSFFMLGGSEAENRRACENIAAMYPSLRVVGRKHGYFSEEEEDGVIELINSAKPDVLWVALGKPKQEFWCVRLKNRVDVGWVKTCGGLYSFLSGNSPRAPRWMQAAGLEWLHRVCCAPRRLFWRYFITNPHSLYVLFFKSNRLK
ncbi:WecB/TagA/CpsF family glycosyltransferase [Saccharophagus degradans]|uniref:WecB/TagA/CpsF family glycosyltransferase n=1 Tax=Saccharophagus degradans TaxID=86304 RepID=UPI0026E3A883|nr:WecB/TagA/CpsF family glycosyltransferase [Saccharophagus degradans]MDO6606033.1 WecB/TagA/CpsF family glycosyltransferase [Saccharophagus degradans]